MAYTCSVCNQVVDGDLVAFQDHTEDHIIDVIKSKNPDWVESDGVCQKCVEYFRKQIKGEG